MTVVAVVTVRESRAVSVAVPPSSFTWFRVARRRTLGGAVSFSRIVMVWTWLPCSVPSPDTELIETSTLTSPLKTVSSLAVNVMEALDWPSGMTIWLGDVYRPAPPLKARLTVTAPSAVAPLTSWAVSVDVWPSVIVRGLARSTTPGTSSSVMVTVACWLPSSVGSFAAVPSLPWTDWIETVAVASLKSASCVARSVVEPVVWPAGIAMVEAVRLYAPASPAAPSVTVTFSETGAESVAVIVEFWPSVMAVGEAESVTRDSSSSEIVIVTCWVPFSVGSLVSSASEPSTDSIETVTASSPASASSRASSVVEPVVWPAGIEIVVEARLNASASPAAPSVTVTFSVVAAESVAMIVEVPPSSLIVVGFAESVTVGWASAAGTASRNRRSVANRVMAGRGNERGGRQRAAGAACERRSGSPDVAHDLT